jgi:hypothetical protein
MVFDFTRYLPRMSAECRRARTRRLVLAGDIFNSRGDHVAVEIGQEVFDLEGNKLYDVKGANIYRPSGELVGHFSSATGSVKRLDRFGDRLFPKPT